MPPKPRMRRPQGCCVVGEYSALAVKVERKHGWSARK